MESRIDGEVLRSVMREVPSAVTVITVKGETEIRGITIGSFASTSLRPPLISFNVSRDAQIYDALIGAERFAVHLLSDEQAYLSDHFASSEMTGEEQFEGVPYLLDALGTPIILDTLAVMHCEQYAVYDAGDHSIVVGRVLKVDLGAHGDPMLYYNRTYRCVGREVQPTTFDPVGSE
jgi:flavin reductase (DIM6/NTAB) family NADH-FMN oxidoreductase RutF